ncbi:DegT/DnrJ/EryC1/StrS family aminotransferase [archaeon]|nr:DegT/DnrJ/EryC1/StrS family aminotransferase [archaeon]
MKERMPMYEEIEKIVKQHFRSLKNKDFIPGETPIPTMDIPFGAEEVNEAIESLLSTYVTMGKKVKKFEEIFSSYVQTKYGTMVNSGSSANFLALSALTNPAVKNRIKTGEEIITPATTWVTTTYPIVNVGAVPVFVDVNLDFNISPDLIEKAITEKTRAIMLVHLLGNPCDMKRIMEIAEANDLYVIEDCCEAHGAEVGNRRVGSFGDMSTFSFFYSHHITTIEGGMIVTNNDEYMELVRLMRAFGWIRDIQRKDQIASQYPTIDPRVLFINMGFNLRPTEINASFGIHQMEKIEDLIKLKSSNALYWNKRLEQYGDWLIIPEERKGTRHSWFVYPLIVKPDAPFTRDEMCRYLESKKIETRLVASGNIIQQPVIDFMHHRKSGTFENSEIIMSGSFFFGNHTGIQKPQREYVADTIDEFMKKF